MTQKLTYAFPALLLISGCAGMQADQSLQSAQTPMRSQGQMATDSGGLVNPKYERITNEILKSRSRLDDQAGSLWSREGQGGYFFSPNRLRREGDSLMIELDGSPKKTLDTKFQVIKKLIAQLEASQRALASSNEDSTADNPTNNPAAQNESAPEAATTASASLAEPEPVKAEAGDSLDVKTVPSKIVERITDGSYRVRGGQSFMIGSREFKVIVTGVVQSDDLKSDGVLASRLLDPQFDIVSVRKR